MARLDELKAKRTALSERSKQTVSEAENITSESYRVAKVSHDAQIIIKNLDAEFEAQTKLHGKDIAFLFFTIALQCVRQYFLTDFKERLSDQKAAKKTVGHTEEHSDRNHRYYNPDIAEIISNPVPFDTTFGAPLLESDIAKHGGHRYTTLGHDPVLGWIFGTANIATSTLTDYKFHSYHIFTGENKVGNRLDKVTNRADTAKVISYTFQKLLNEGKDGKIKVGASIIKEAIHLKSDINTFNSLPIPVISTFNPDLASSLAHYGLDISNVFTITKQAVLAEAINMIVAMIHRLTYNEENDGKKELFEVRSRKIITYSNVIASTSNVIAVGLGSAIGVSTNNPALIKKSLSKIDIGGFAVTLFRLINDHKFIQQIKQEFILDNFDKLIQGDI